MHVTNKEFVILSGATAARSAAAAESKDPYSHPNSRSNFPTLPIAAIATVLLLTSLSTSAAAQAKPIALKNGKILTISHGVIENGTVIMQAGKIKAVGASTSITIPTDAQIIDATGMTIYPGLIDSETNLGLTEISSENMTNDLAEPSDEIMPHIDR